MPKIAYETKDLRPDTLALIEWAADVAEEYAAMGFDLTVRQLYYQGVTANLFPNEERSYKRLGNIVSAGRMAGLIDWDHLTDRGRNAMNTGWFDHNMPSVPDVVRKAAQSRSVDLWDGQEFRVEVWVEKQALEQVVERAARQMRCGYIACKGYMSQSEMWVAGHKRFRRWAMRGQSPVVLHLGDHDPSGIDMTRDIRERLALFTGYEIDVVRIALNMDQIERFDPPPNPAKVTDSRFFGYQEKFGDESWELDALRPEYLVKLIQEEIESYIDPVAWNEQVKAEKAAMAEVRRIATYWPEVEAYLDDLDDDPPVVDVDPEEPDEEPD